MRCLFVVMLWLGGCARCAFPADATPVPGVLDALDDCGFWSLAVGEHVVVGLPLGSPDTTCTTEIDEGIALNSQPIFTNFEPDGPRFTFDFVAEAEARKAHIDVECSDGSAWSALVDVTP